MYLFQESSTFLRIQSYTVALFHILYPHVATWRGARAAGPREYFFLCWWYGVQRAPYHQYKYKIVAGFAIHTSRIGMRQDMRNR